MQISSNLHSNVSRSTRIKSSSVHTYIFVCFTLRVILQGFVTQNATDASGTASVGGTEWLNTPSVDVTEWLNTPSVDPSGSASAGISGSASVGRTE